MNTGAKLSCFFRGSRNQFQRDRADRNDFAPPPHLGPSRAISLPGAKRVQALLGGWEVTMEAKPLSIGDEISASITVRGNGVTQDSAIAAAAPKLGEWQRAQASRLPDGTKYEPSDIFTDKPQGEHSVTRTLKVVEDGASQEHEA